MTISCREEVRRAGKNSVQGGCHDPTGIAQNGGVSRLQRGEQPGRMVCSADRAPLRTGKELRQKKAGPQLRAAMRAWQSRPVLQRLRRAMELVRRRTLPQGLLGQAIDYALKRWEALNRFVDDGVLEIDNNIIENSIRPSALGKKNWLFVGHPEAGERSAVIYTLLGSCRRLGINPFDYLKDLFTHLPAAKTTQIQDFTPAAWVNARKRKVAQAA
jgi:transposase